jgi:hypothetical protein
MTSTEARLSDRLAAVVAALPLRPGMRVLEIAGAPGSAGHILVPTGSRLYYAGIALSLLAAVPFLYHLRLLGFHY